MPTETGPVRGAQEPPAGRPTDTRVTAATMLYRPAAWLSPVVLGQVLSSLISLVYLGVFVNPTSHLRGLPVLIVNEDNAVRTQTGPVDLGREITGQLTRTPAVSAAASALLARTTSRLRERSCLSSPPACPGEAKASSRTRPD